MARKLERKSISQSVIAEDVINGGSKGELANLTREGLMLRCPSAVPTEAIFQFKLKLSAPIGGSDEIALGADCMWCTADSGTGHYWAGFQIIDISSEAVNRIDTLIAQYGR